MKNTLCTGMLLMGAMFMTSSCLDKDYDLNNLDLTVGLGSEGLGVRIGQTEKIYLENILEVDQTVRLDKNNLYYLVEDGTSAYDFRIDRISARVERAVIGSQNRVLSFEQALGQCPGIPAGVEEFEVSPGFMPEGHASGSDCTKVRIDQISADVKQIKRVYSNSFDLNLSLEMVNAPGVKFDIHSFRDLKITVPPYLHISRINTPGWKLDGQVLRYDGEMLYSRKEVCSVTADYMDLQEYGKPVNGSIVLDEEMVRASFDGDIIFHVTAPFTMRKGDYADIRVGITHNNGDSEVMIDAVTGRFDPEITVADQQIDIASSLPDFLKDESVRVNVTNPTIKLQSDMTAVPVGLQVSAQLNSIKEGKDGFNVPVSLPAAPVEDHTFNTVYYCQGDTPYDPEGLTEPSVCRQVTTLSTLLNRLPDYIHVGFGDGRIKVQDKDYTVVLGRSYQTAFQYKIYVPFEFANGLNIVYNDSTDSMADDLADYTAEGVTVTAEAYNTIPLDLLAEIYAVDASGHRIKDIHFDRAPIAPSADGVTEQCTQVTISARLEDPTLLQKIDRLFFRVEAASGVSDSPHQLLSTQYLQFKEIRLNLDGQVTGNFN